ncbi:MAG: hypothetical protein A3I11_01385 [Elusimicrobia bacterium RIFCSPLOWO2_02_FULL_39_32]|nr:MAG: hypothetical protein A3B80_05870 [Elusimicrobia bacterium RIFCSPHIGHO2_02_FULL_39_36]OGR92336.1 MAG: hypothetical protein A3I11_01385 [Elusimicrobia bacterium RIFCSPLOWO2_02_FULL_39_32]OGR98879.1 MAG: hypothetical protein A3G85_03690 [Elusimicrobia bacterium RIFCSPLOWO2_12_FULL_39_28]
MIKSLTKYFFRGILFLTPLVLTLYLFYAVFAKIDQLGNKILEPWIGQGNLLTGIGFLLTIFLITCAGYFSSVWIGAAFLHWIEKQFFRSPLIKGIYGSIREILNSFFGKEKFFSRAVLVNFPNLGFKRVGFITQETASFMHNGEEQIVVYLPHSFQISGNMLIVPKTQVEFLDMPPEKALKLIMSAGIVKN